MSEAQQHHKKGICLMPCLWLSILNTHADLPIMFYSILIGTAYKNKIKPCN